MEKWRTKVGLAALASAALLAFAPSAANANYRNSCDPCNICNPCDSCCEGGGFDFGVDFLWWKPSISDLHSSVRFEDDSDSGDASTWTRHHQICPDWQPGVKAYFLWPRCMSNFGVYGSYTFVDVEQRHHHKREEDWSRHRFHFNYNEWDVCATYEVGCNDCHHFTPFFGLAGIILNTEHKNHHHEYEEWHHRAESEFWAVGLRAGAAYKFRICDGFHFFSFGHGSLLAGRNDNHERHHERSHNDQCSHVIPGLHLGTGLAYNMNLCDWSINFRVGYEFLVWWDVPTGREFIAGNDLNFRPNTRNERNIAFQGLLVGAGIGF